jgi:hypothetical protein
MRAQTELEATEEHTGTFDLSWHLIQRLNCNTMCSLQPVGECNGYQEVEMFARSLWRRRV